MTRTEFENEQYKHTEVVDAVSHLAYAQIAEDDIKTMLIKITDIDISSMEALIFIKKQNDYCTLYRIEFKIVNLEKFDNFIIQNCAKVTKCYELGARKNYMLIQGLTANEANAECFKYFLNTRTFEDKRTIKKLENKKH